MYFECVNILVILAFCFYSSIHDILGFDVGKFITMVARHAVMFTIATFSGKFDISYEFNVVAVVAYVFTWYSIFEYIRFKDINVMEYENVESIAVMLFSHSVMFFTGSFSIMEGTVIAIACGLVLMERMDMYKLRQHRKLTTQLEKDNALKRRLNKPITTDEARDQKIVEELLGLHTSSDTMYVSNGSIGNLNDIEKLADPVI